MPSPDGDEHDYDIEEISPHIRLRINPQKKLEWLQYADEHDLTLTDLIKEGVDNTISGTWVLDTDEEDEDTEQMQVDVDVSGLEEGMDELLSHVQALETQLDDVTIAEAAEETEPLSRDELITIGNRSINQLPEVPDGDTLIEITRYVVPIDHAEKPHLTGTVPDVADAIDEDEHHVRQALIFYEAEQMGNVSSIIHEGVRHWYEVNPNIDREDFEDIETDYSGEFQKGTDLDYGANE